MLSTIIGLKHTIGKLRKQLTVAQHNAQYYQHEYRAYSTLVNRYQRKYGTLPPPKYLQKKKKTKLKFSPYNANVNAGIWGDPRTSTAPPSSGRIRVTRPDPPLPEWIYNPATGQYTQTLSSEPALVTRPSPPSVSIENIEISQSIGASTEVSYLDEMGNTRFIRRPTRFFTDDVVTSAIPAPDDPF